MSLYAISDVHLGFKYNKTMDKFGDNWINHHNKIKKNWENTVTLNDTVILSGDISWAMNVDDAKPDLDFLEVLPGNKIIHEGNHDFWWSSASKLNGIYKTIFFMKNDCVIYGDYAICGTRGWTCPNDTAFTEHDFKIYTRELGRLKRSLNKAKTEKKDKIIVTLHFPPTNDKREESGFTQIINEFGVEKVIYGHLHNEKEGNVNSLEGLYKGVSYNLVSSDYLEFAPKLIL